MMRKIILSDKIEIDLSNKSISENSENSIFSDTFFVKQTYPFDLFITDEIDLALGLISSYNTSKNIFIDCVYVHNNFISKAILEIVEIIGEKASVVVKYGFDEFPSFTKKLSELPLDNFNVPNIYTHANSVLNDTWPTVNYNFPMIHTKKYDEDELFTTFQGIINKRVNGIFVENDYNSTEFVSYNRNIIQPLPYLFHILEKGFLDGGYILEGDILIDNLLKNSTIFSSADYFKKNQSTDIMNLTIKQTEYFNVLPIQDSPSFQFYYEKSITFAQAGVYKITGSHYTQTPGSGFRGWKLNGVTIGIAASSYYDPNTIEFFSTYDTYIVITQNNSVLTFYENGGWLTTTDDDILNVNFQLITAYNGSSCEPIIQNENKVDLTKSVPDMTFADFVTMIKNYFNYDITGISGNKIYMNKVISYLNYSNVKDLSSYEVKRVPRKFEEGNSFLLEFESIESTEYTYEKVFQDKNGVVTQGYSVDNEKTKTITIKALPLPILDKSNVITAYSFENDDTKPYFVGYSGLTNNINIAKPYEPYLLPNIHPIYWYNWFKFRLSAQVFRWQFFKDDVEIQDVSIKDIIHAYQNIHLIKSIDKTEIKPGIFSFEIETYA